METQKKKSPRSLGFSNLNFSIGLAISVFLVVCAFEWKTETSIVAFPDPPENPIGFTGIEVIVLPEKEVEIPKPKLPIKEVLTDKVEAIDDEIKIEENIKLINIDSDDFKIEDFQPAVESAPEAPFVLRAEIMPEFKYKKMNFNEYIGSKFRFPSKASGLSGTVILQFIIDHDGSVTDILILRGIDPAIDEEAVRVVKNSPKWIPARQGDKTVRLKMVLPIKVGIQPVN